MFQDVDPDERATQVGRRKTYLAELDAQVAYRKSLSNDDAECGKHAHRLFEFQREAARTALAPLETRSFSRDGARVGDASFSSHSPVHARRSPVSSGAHFGVEREADARRKESAARYKFELEKQIAALKAAKEAAAREARRMLELEEARVEAEREALMRRFRKEESRTVETVPDEGKDDDDDDKDKDEDKDKDKDKDNDDDDETIFIEESKFIDIHTTSLPLAHQPKVPRDDKDVPVAPVIEKATPIERGSVRSMASMWQRRVETLATHE